MIVETNASEYTLIAIFSIITKEKKIHSVIFHSCIFKAIELSYNIYNKELLTVLKAFYTWYYYLKELKLSIDIIMDYKNLEYFLTTKILSYCQARWLEFLFQFNLIICFCPEHLGSKPDTITHKKYLYLREGRAMYNSINSQNICPIFIYNQLITFLQATALVSLTLQTTTVIDVDGLYSNIWLAIIQDKILQEYLHHPVKYWSLGTSRLKNKKIYTLQKDDLCMYILQYYYDHILIDHFRQNNVRTHLLWLYLAIPICKC